jgi:hypothetical protein
LNSTQQAKIKRTSDLSHTVSAAAAATTDRAAAETKTRAAIVYVSERERGIERLRTRKRAAEKTG